MRISDWSSDVCSSDLTVLLVLVLMQASPSAADLPSCPELGRAVTDVMRQDARLRDWAQPGRYRDENRLLPPPARPYERRVGEEGVSRCTSRRSPCKQKKKE